MKKSEIVDKMVGFIFTELKPKGITHSEVYREMKTLLKLMEMDKVLTEKWESDDDL